MGIKSCALFIIRRRMAVNLMFIVIEKRSPRWKLLGVKHSFEYCFFIFKGYFSINLPNLSLQTNICHIKRRYMHQIMWSNSQFGGKNDQFCIYPWSDYRWEDLQKRQSPIEHIFVFVRINEESHQQGTL